jgi:hypothetical protein
VWDAASKESTFVTEGRSPDWSPDGNELAYATGSGHSTPGEIYAIEPTTTGTPRNLSNDPSNYDAQPAWSPDGAQIAFVKDLDSNLYGPRLYVMNSDGSEQSLIVDGLFAADPAWSPSGRRIAFRGSKPNWHDTEIFTVRPDGSGLRQVTENKDSESSPAWTSDGLGLLYASTSSRFPVAPLYLLRLGEQDRRRIGCRASPDDFDWGSPDQAAGHIDVAALGKRRAPTHLDAYRDRNYVTTQIFAPKGPCEPPDEDCVGGRTLLLKKRRPGRDRLLNKQRTTQRGLSYLDTRGERGGMYTVIRGESFTSPEGRKVICEPARADVREPR